MSLNKKKTKTTTKKPIRALGGSKATPRPRATESKRKPTRNAGGRVSRWFEPWETWGTISPPDRFSQRKPSVCLWGDQQTAIEGCDPDERVCLVRVEVLEVLD